MDITENPIFAKWVAEHDSSALWDLYGAEHPPAGDATVKHITDLDEWLREGGVLPWFVDGWARARTRLVAHSYETALGMPARESVVQRCAAAVVTRYLDDGFVAHEKLMTLERATDPLPENERETRYRARVALPVALEWWQRLGEAAEQ